MPIRVARETTYFTEPLRPDGSVDYVAALNLRDRVEPDDNAAIPLSHVLGYELPREAFDVMGAPALDASAPRFVGGIVKWDDYAAWRNEHALAPVSSDVLTESLVEAKTRPWTRDEFPELWSWLADNEAALDVIREATARGEHWIPASDPLIETPIPSLLSVRNVGQALRARAALHVAEGRGERAADDLELLLRFSRLYEGQTLIGALISRAVLEMGLESIPLVATQPGVSPEALARLNASLAVDDRLRSYAAAFGAERFAMLDLLGAAAASGRADPVSVEGVAVEPLAIGLNRFYDLAIEATLEENTTAWMDRIRRAETALRNVTEPPSGVFASFSAEKDVRAILAAGALEVRRLQQTLHEARAHGRMMSLYLEMMSEWKNRAARRIPANELDAPTSLFYTIEYLTHGERAFALIATPIASSPFAGRTFCAASDGSAAITPSRDGLDTKNAHCSEQ